MTVGGYTYAKECIPGLPCQAQTLVLSYKRDFNSWHREQDLPSPRRLLSCIKTEYGQRDVLLAAGGISLIQETGTFVVEPAILAFDLRLRTWSEVEISQKPPNLRNTVLGIIGRELFFVGGAPVTDTTINGTWQHVGAFSLDTGDWQTRSDLDFSINSLNGFWYSFEVMVVKWHCKRQTFSDLLREIHIYDLENAHFHNLTSFPVEEITVSVAIYRYNKTFF